MFNKLAFITPTNSMERGRYLNPFDTSNFKKEAALKTKRLHLCFASFLVFLTMIIVPFLACCEPGEVIGGRLTIPVIETPNLTLLKPAGQHLPFRRLMYDPLINVEDDGSYTPRLATSWEYDDTTYTWTITLREGVKWHDGVDFTAADVKFTYETAMDIPGSMYQNMWGQDVEECTIVDDHTIEFKLKENLRGWIANLKEERAEIVPKHIWEQQEDPATYLNLDNPIGTGPFKFKEGDFLTYALFEDNPDYWGGAPHIAEVLCKVYANIDAQILALKSGEIDCITGKAMTSLASVASFIADPNIHVALRDANRYDSLRINLYHSPNNVKEFRHALSWAIDRQEICDTVYYGYAQPAQQVPFVPPALRDAEAIAWPGGGINPATGEKYTDAERIAKANDILDDLGWLDTDDDGYREGPMGLPGATTTAKLSFVMQIGPTPSHARSAEIVQDNLADIGIEVIVTTSTFTTIFNKLKNVAHDWDWYLGGHGQPIDWYIGLAGYFNDPTDMSSAFMAGPIGFDYPLVQDKMTASLTASGATFDTLVEDIQELWADYLPLIPLHTTLVVAVYRDDNLTGWDLEVQTDPPLFVEPDFYRVLLKLRQA